jgi:hypothetical protein
METAFPRCRAREGWKTLYRAAILEKDIKMVAQRVSAAEAAVLARGRELFYTPATAEELEALEDALYALRAFKTAWRHTADDGPDTIH